MFYNNIKELVLNYIHTITNPYKKTYACKVWVAKYHNNSFPLGEYSGLSDKTIQSVQSYISFLITQGLMFD